ncbi:MAG: hypothetical protein ABFD46_04865 [Armatimonadota bacterium]
MRTGIFFVIVPALAAFTVAGIANPQDTQPVEVYPAVTIGGGVLSLDLPQDIKAVDKVNKVEIRPVKLDGGYVVVVSDSTYKDAEWSKVVHAISYKYSAEILVYTGQVTSVKDELSKRMPRYTCFIAKPEEANEQYVLDVLRMSRKLDDDIYMDTFSGILTGYSVRDALRIASCSEPLVVHKALSAAYTIPVENLEEVTRYNESKKNCSEVKGKDGVVKAVSCPDDLAKELVDGLNDGQPDMFVTSGHSSEDNWLIGYKYNAGEFRCKNGVLYGMDTNQNIYAVNSPNPKVYLAPGNCLIGHIKNKQSMALAYMGSCGVNQMAAYLSLTDQGFSGWGTYYYFVCQPGRFNLVESWYLSKQLLISKLENRMPGANAYEIKQYRTTSADKIASDLGFSEVNPDVMWIIKLIVDRDIFVLYGDPAWDARLVTRNLYWEQSLTEKDGVYTFEVKGIKDSSCKRPPSAIFPERLKNIKILEGQGLNPVIADDFLILPDINKIEKDKTYKVVFKAEKA